MVSIIINYDPAHKISILANICKRRIPVFACVGMIGLISEKGPEARLYHTVVKLSANRMAVKGSSLASSVFREAFDMLHPYRIHPSQRV